MEFLVDQPKLSCPVCRNPASLFDVVDLNKSCWDQRGEKFGLSGIPIFYAICGHCQFCFSPEIYTWSLAEFEKYIYNDQYILVDPEYTEIRPKANATNLVSMFGALPETVKHLDYGGGNGLLTQYLKESNWNSNSYDPFVNKEIDINQLGQFNLITAFEVFEHVPDVQALMSDLSILLAPGGLVLFSTLLSDDQIKPDQRLNWWYASPRNGHISLFSRQSLQYLSNQYQFGFASFSSGFHVFYTEIPLWAAHLIQKS